MSSPADTASVVQALEKAGVKRLLGATIAGVEDEVPYELVPSGVEFADAEVSRQAVTQAILDILNGEESEYVRKSFGLGKPNTHYGKPSFY